MRMTATPRRLAGCACCATPRFSPSRPTASTAAASSPAAPPSASVRPAVLRPSPAPAQAAAAKRIDVHHHFLAAVPSRGAPGQPRQRRAAELDRRRLAPGHGQGRRRDGDAVRHAARRVVRQCRAGPQPRAALQRVRGAAREGSHRQVRHVRDHPAPRHRGQPQGDRIRPRRAQGRRHRADDELLRQVSRRSRLPAGVRGAQPPQGRGLRPPDDAGLLQGAGQGTARSARSNTRPTPPAPSRA